MRIPWAVALQEIVQALIQVQQFDQALIVAETIRDRRCKVAALQEVAQALFKIRSKEHAVAIMNLALAGTESIEDRGNKVAALCEISQILFQFGEKVKCIKCIRSGSSDSRNDKKSRGQNSRIEHISTSDDPGTALRSSTIHSKVNAG